MWKNKPFLIGIGIVILLIILFLLPRFTNLNRELIAAWKAGGVGCLPSHQNAALHIHTSLEITVDGREEVPPAAGTGIVRGCMAEVHTHEADGVIHIESVNPGTTFTLGQFFAIWGKTIERPGYSATASVDGNLVSNPDDIILKNDQLISIAYAKQ